MQKITSSEFMEKRVTETITSALEEGKFGQSYKISNFDQRVIHGQDGVYYNFELVEKAAISNPDYQSFLGHLTLTDKPKRIADGTLEGRIEYENVVIFEEHYLPEEVEHVDHGDSDEQITFSAVLQLYIYEISSANHAEKEFTDHVACFKCETTSMYVPIGTSTCPVCLVDGHLAWFDEVLV